VAKRVETTMEQESMARCVFRHGIRTPFSG
jgi:hypothetical protein